MARPPLKDRSKVLSTRTPLRVTVDEKQRWQAAAKRAGQSFSAWMRASLDRSARF